MRKAINHLKKADPVMASIIAKAGPYRVGYTEPVFQTLVRSIVFQQLHGKAAQTIFNAGLTHAQVRAARAGSRTVESRRARSKPHNLHPGCRGMPGAPREGEPRLALGAPSLR